MAKIDLEAVKHMYEQSHGEAFANYLIDFYKALTPEALEFFRQSAETAQKALKAAPGIPDEVIQNFFLPQLELLHAAGDKIFEFDQSTAEKISSVENLYRSNGYYVFSRMKDGKLFQIVLGRAEDDE